MSRWFEHPVTSRTLIGSDQVLTLVTYINEAKQSFSTHFCDPSSKESPLSNILKILPEKGSIKKEWLRRVLENGPMNDKIESMGSLIADLPMYSLFYIDYLISLVNVNKKRLAILSSRTLTNLFTNCLLPKTRPLIDFNQRPISILFDMKPADKSKSAILPRQKVLCLWYFEEQLKIRYTKFLNSIEQLLKLEPDKRNRIDFVNQVALLCRCYEQQSTIIDILVNKLGDKNRKVVGVVFPKLVDLGGYRRSYLNKIIRSVRKFVFRPNLPVKSQYYAVQLLARSKIARKSSTADKSDEEEENPAVELVNIYVGVLKRSMEGESGAVRSEKLFAAAMKGLSRAIPFTNSADLQKHTETLFRLVHSANLNVSLHVLRVLFILISKNRENDERFDRYMRLVYATLTQPALFFNSHKVSVIEIVFKSVAIDQDSLRAKAFVKRVLQLCLQHPEPGFICVCLLMLSRLINTKHQSVFEFKTIDNAKKEKMPKIEHQKAVADNNDSGDEQLMDIESDDENENKTNTEKDNQLKSTSWVHYQTSNQSEDVNKDASASKRSDIYDPFARNPKYANTEKECLIELELLKNHWSPSVRIFAQHILKEEKITYTSDPTEDMSLIKFLDRFAYKNPKKEENKRKSLLNKPKTIEGVRIISVNTKEFADLSEDKVPEDQLFFHKFFNHSTPNNKNLPTDAEIESDFSVSDTEFDKFIMKDNEEFPDQLNLSGSEMEEDEEIEFSDFTDDGEDDLFGEDEEMEDKHFNVDVDDDEMEELEQGEDEEESEEDDEESDEDDESETIHSSKRRRLGSEMSSITIGAMKLGKTFDKIKDNTASQIRSDRKRRKTHKQKNFNSKTKFEGKSGKRKHKK